MNSSTLEREFSAFIQPQLIESCDQMFNDAKNYCKNSYVGQYSCEWYHSAWQYLRIVDKVSSPTWHFNFYYEQLSDLLSSSKKILISGTADYTLLALIYFIAKKKEVMPLIWVNDICSTPISVCRRFAEINNFELKIIQGDIRVISIEKYFDLIITDAFLTRFSFSEKEAIVAKWSSLLKDNGRIITTGRIEESIEHNERIKILNEKSFYKQEVEVALNNSSLINIKEKIVELAEKYISEIISMPFKSQEEIENLFSKSGLVVSHGENAIVKGEVKPTKYYRFVAEKS